MVAFDEDAQIALFRNVFQRDYMRQDRSARIDFNAVSYTEPGGTPETVLDYMDSVLKDKTQPEEFLKELKRLRRFFVERLGAKKFNEFDEAVQAKYMRVSS